MSTYFSADHSDGQENTVLPGSAVIASGSADPVEQGVDASLRMKADLGDNRPQSHIDPATGFVTSDIFVNNKSVHDESRIHSDAPSVPANHLV